MPATPATFEPPNYEAIRQSSIDQESNLARKELILRTLRKDQDDDKKLLETDVFESFFQKKSDSSRKKILLVISGSHKDDGCNSQYYPNYLKEMARSNPDCDFLVLNIDPHFTTNLSPEVTEKKENVDLKLLKGHLNPAKNPQFYSQIGNNLHRFNKVVFCSHTCQVGALDFNPLHHHCQEKEIDCITIGAYFDYHPCCIIKEPLIQQKYVPLEFFNKDRFYIDRDLLPKEGLENYFPDSNQISTLSFVFRFLDIDFGSATTDTDKKIAVEERKKKNPTNSIELFTGIEDPDFIKAVGNFINPEQTKLTPAQPSPPTQSATPAESAIIGAGVGVITGLACVSALGLGIVSAPAIAIVAGTAIVGASAFYLINQENSKR